MNMFLQRSLRKKSQTITENIAMDQSLPKPLNEQIEELRKWCVDQDSLPELSDQELTLFLHSCEYNIEATKECVLCYYKLRTESPEFFLDRDPLAPRLIQASTSGYSVLLPGATNEGYKVILLGYAHTDSSTYDFQHSQKRFLMIMDMWLSQLEPCPGILIMVDCKNSTFGHVTAMSYDGIKKLSMYFQEALPVRLKGVYFINISSAMNMLLSIAQPFLSKKITSVIFKYVRGNEEYQRAIPKEMLPLDLGGECGTLEELKDAVSKELENHVDWFRQEDEKIRLLRNKNRKSIDKTERTTSM